MKFAHQDVVDLARHGSVPVINGLSDQLHPCQALADFFTLMERHGKLDVAKPAREAKTLPSVLTTRCRNPRRGCSTRPRTSRACGRRARR
jgi:hypothetical protein